MSTLNIQLLCRKSRNNSLNYRYLLPELVPWLTLSGSNYPCLERISMVPKMFEPLKFDCIYKQAWEQFLMVGLFVKFTNQYGAVLLGMCLICDESCYIYKSLWEQVLLVKRVLHVQICVGICLIGVLMGVVGMCLINTEPFFHVHISANQFGNKSYSPILLYCVYRSVRGQVC